MRLPPGEVVVVMYELDFPATEKRDDLTRHPLAAGVRVLSGERHQRPIVLPHRPVERQQRFALRDTRAPLLALREREEP
jgi:hypothetical protein